MLNFVRKIQNNSAWQIKIPQKYVLSFHITNKISRILSKTFLLCPKASGTFPLEHNFRRKDFRLLSESGKNKKIK